MARINLLPWRDELRKQRQREFAVAAAGSAVLAGLVVFYVHLHINGLIDHQKDRNQFLEERIEVVEKKIQEIRDLERRKEQLLARMRIIERLQGNRSAIVHLFDELVDAIPDGMFLVSLTQKGNDLTVQGRAESNARVSAFMRNLDGSPWFTDPSLEVIQRAGRGGDAGGRDFTLNVKQTSPEDQADGEGE